jgi:hypothetical protein
LVKSEKQTQFKANLPEGKIDAKHGEQHFTLLPKRLQFTNQSSVSCLPKHWQQVKGKSNDRFQEQILSDIDDFYSPAGACWLQSS